MTNQGTDEFPQLNNDIVGDSNRPRSAVSQVQNTPQAFVTREHTLGEYTLALGGVDTGDNEAVKSGNEHRR